MGDVVVLACVLLLVCCKTHVASGAVCLSGVAGVVIAEVWLVGFHGLMRFRGYYSMAGLNGLWRCGSALGACHVVG